MAEFSSRYQAKIPDELGIVAYSDSENDVWRQLYERQQLIIKNRACQAFVDGLGQLQLINNKIPQLPVVNKLMKAATGWQVSPVAALITAEEFFNLLAKRNFPAATFIRVPQELNYVTEPDIFHELYGHCPMLMEPVFADFVSDFAKRVLSLDKKEWPLLQRLFWFTVEFGLIQTQQGLRIYGGGILSSIEETPYSVDSDKPVRKPFDVLDILRTPYRIDQLQSVYFVINSFDQLYQVVDDDLSSLLQQAHELGEHKPLFKVDPNNPSVHINAC